MINKSFFQWLFASDLIDELARWRANMTEFRRWFAGQHDVDFVLAHIEANARGLQSISGCEGQSGPRDASWPRAVRDELMRRAIARREARSEREARAVRDEVRARAAEYIQAISESTAEKAALAEDMQAIEALVARGCIFDPPCDEVGRDGWRVYDRSCALLSGRDVGKSGPTPPPRLAKRRAPSNREPAGRRRDGPATPNPD